MSDDSQPRSQPAAAPGVTAPPSSADGRDGATTPGAPSPPSDAGRASPPRAVGGWRNSLSSLKYRDYRYLWLGLLLMMSGISMQMVARGYLTYELTSSPIKLSLVSGGFALPMLTLSLFGGAAADRMERKRVIQIGQTCACMLALFIAVSLTTGTVTWVHLFGVSVGQGAVFAFLMPARQAIIPQLVGKENLTNAMALSAAVMSATSLVTPAIAGGIYRYFGADVVYYVIASLMAMGVLLTSFIRAKGEAQARPSVPVFRDILAGFSYIRGNRLVMVLLIMALFTALLAMPFRMGLMPIYIIDVYQRGPEALGVMVAVAGSGSLMGTMAIAALGARKRGLLMIFGSYASAAALLLIASVPVYLFAVGVMVLMGLGDAGRRTLNMALLMEEVEDEYRGRVMSVFMMNFGLMPLGVLPAGAITELFGAQWAVAILGILLLLTTTVILLTQKSLRDAE